MPAGVLGGALETKWDIVMVSARSASFQALLNSINMNF